MRLRHHALAVALAGLAVAGPALADDWAGWGGDLQRSRRSAEKSGATFRAEWQHALPGGTDLALNAIVSSPAVGDDVLVFGTQRETVHALDAVTGKPLWVFKSEAFVLTSPTVYRGRVFVSGVGAVVALRARDGKPLWRNGDLDVSHTSPVVVNDERGAGILVAGEAPTTKLFRLDASTGKVVWTAPTNRGSMSSVTVSGATALVAQRGGKLQAFDVKTGEPQWVHEAGGDVYMSSPTVVGPTVYLLSTGETPKLHAVNVADGEARESWPVALPLPLAATGTGTLIKRQIAESSLAVAAGRLLVQLRIVDPFDTNKDPTTVERYLMNETAFAVDIATGRVAWQRSTGERSSTNANDVPHLTTVPTPAVFEREGAPVVALGSSLSAKLTIVDGANGTVLSTVALRSTMRSSPTFANGRLYVATDAGTVESFLSQSNRPPAAASVARPDTTVPRTGIVLRWKNGVDPDGDALGGIIRIDRDGEVLEDWQTEVTIAAGQTSASIPGALADDTTYSYAIRLRDPSGAWAPWSPTYTMTLVETPSVSLRGSWQPSITIALGAAVPGDTVWLGAGVFRLGDTLTLPAGVSLGGSGPQATVLRADGLDAGISVAGHAAGARTTIRSLTVTGAGVGIDLRDDGDAEIRNVVLHDNTTAGVAVAKGGTALVVNTTMAKNGTAVDARGSATVKNSLVVENQTGLSAQAGGTLISRYNNLFDNETAYAGVAAHATDRATTITFEDRGKSDFRIGKSQPSTDMGDPADEFSLEPMPNGNRINLGAFGNTTEAETSAPAEATEPRTVAKRKHQGCAVGGDGSGSMAWALFLLSIPALLRRWRRG